MEDWGKLCRILDNAADSGAWAKIPADMVQELAFLVRQHVNSISTVECMKLVFHLNKAYGESFWITTPSNGVIRVRFRGGWKKEDACQLYSELMEYYVSTDDINTESPVQLLLNVGGCPMRLEFESFSTLVASKGQVDNVKRWSKDYVALRFVTTPSDIIVWNNFFDSTGLVPFTVSHFQSLL